MPKSCGDASPMLRVTVRASAPGTGSAAARTNAPSVSGPAILRIPSPTAIDRTPAGRCAQGADQLVGAGLHAGQWPSLRAPLLGRRAADRSAVRLGQSLPPSPPPPLPFFGPFPGFGPL